MKGSRKLKRWVETKCTLHRSLRSLVIAVDHFSQFKGIIVITYGLETENGATLQELLEKLPVSV